MSKEELSGYQKGALKIKAKNPNHFKEIGRKGGIAKVPKGFAYDKALARRVGTIGGSVSGYNKRKRKLSGDSMDDIKVEQ